MISGTSTPPGSFAAGCDLVTVQRALGHKSATVTLTTYTHLWPTAEDRMRAAAGAMLAETLRTADYVRTERNA
jgi:integrase